MASPFILYNTSCEISSLSFLLWAYQQDAVLVILCLVKRFVLLHNLFCTTHQPRGLVKIRHDNVVCLMNALIAAHRFRIDHRRNSASSTRQELSKGHSTDHTLSRFLLLQFHVKCAIVRLIDKAELEGNTNRVLRKLLNMTPTLH